MDPKYEGIFSITDDEEYKKALALIDHLMCNPNNSQQELFILDIMAALVENYEAKTENMLLHTVRADLIELESPSPNPDLYNLGIDCAINHIDLMIKRREDLLQQMKEGLSLKEELASSKKLELDKQVAALVEEYSGRSEHLDEMIHECHEDLADNINYSSMEEQILWLVNYMGDTVKGIREDIKDREEEKRIEEEREGGENS